MKEVMKSSDERAGARSSVGSSRLDPTGDVKRVACTVVIQLPRNCPCYAIGTGHPGLPLRVLGCMPVSDWEMVEEVEVEGRMDPEEVTELFRANPAVKSAEVISRFAETSTHRVVVPLCPVISTYQSLRILPRFPHHIQDGRERFLVVTTPEKVREFLRMLKENFQGVEIKVITHDFSDGSKSILTPRQREIFRMALSSGFWDIPRRATLTDLASMLGIAKSTVHETIAAIENKLIHEESSKLLEE